MIANLTPSDSLTAVLAGAAATTNPIYMATYADESVIVLQHPEITVTTAG